MALKPDSKLLIDAATPDREIARPQRPAAFPPRYPPLLAGKEDGPVFYLAMVFFILTVLAALLGFDGPETIGETARTLFWIFAAAFVFTGLATLLRYTQDGRTQHGPQRHGGRGDVARGRPFRDSSR